MSTTVGTTGATTTGATTSVSTTSSTAASTSSSTSSGSGGMCTGGEPVVEAMGSKTSVLLKGTVLLPTGPIQGQVLINGNTIACADVDCSAQATGATVVDTKGIISPGLVDAHNHILYDVFNEDDWSPTQTYTNHDQWPNDPRYKAMVNAKQYIDGESSTWDYACEMDKYGELKGLIAGTTSIQASPGTARLCYRTISRTVDTAQNGLPADAIQTATIFPSTATADGVCANFTNGKTDAYVIHIGEGVDATAHAEFAKLYTITTTDGCLYNPKTAIVHGTALDGADFAQMATNQMSLVWSPRSNVFLYGGGTDLTKTTDVAQAVSQGVNVAIAPDWSIGGSQNMLDEMRFADAVDNGRFGDVLKPEDIWKMATINAARALGVNAYIGSIEVGKRADLAVFAGDTQKPFDTVLGATPREVSMVFVDGRFLYGDATVQSLGPDDAVCEQITICCRSKAACIAETGGTPADKTGQTVTDIQQALDTAMTSYDALMLSQWTFAPVAPLVKCQ